MSKLLFYYYREKVNWITQVFLLMYRSAMCFLRNYKEKLLEIGTLLVKLKYLAKNRLVNTVEIV